MKFAETQNDIWSIIRIFHNQDALGVFSCTTTGQALSNESDTIKIISSTVKSFNLSLWNFMKVATDTGFVFFDKPIACF